MNYDNEEVESGFEMDMDENELLEKDPDLLDEENLYPGSDEDKY